MKYILIGIVALLIGYAILITYMQLNHFNHFNSIPQHIIEKYEKRYGKF
jgi:hypothetical protein